jgi:branched-chain amino acid transport system permease protein
MEWVNIIIQGVLIGGLYAMFAAGLALIFGVMRLVNIAHGDLIVLAAHIALMPFSARCSTARSATTCCRRCW